MEKANTPNSSLTDQIVGNFVRDFLNHEKSIKEEARLVPVKDPITGVDTDLRSEIAYLVASNISLTDIHRIFKQFPNLHLPVIETVGRGLQVETALLQMIQLAEAHNLIDDGLEKKLGALKEENVELNKRIEDLSKQLKECLEYKNRVQPLDKGRKDKGDSMLGDVIR